jgi:hypothetical protein
MSQKSLSTRSLLDLVDLFERSSHAVVDGDGQRLHGVPGWDLSGRLALSDRDLAAWTERIGFAGSYLAPAAMSAFRSTSRKTMIRVGIAIGAPRHSAPSTSLLIWSPSCGRCREAAELLGGPARCSTSATKRHYSADDRWCPVAHRQDARCRHAGRCLAGPRSRVIDRHGVSALPYCAAPRPGVDLHHRSVTARHRHAPPRAYRIVPIASALVDHALKPHFDIDLIHRLLLAPSGSKLERSLPVRFDRYSNTLVIATKSEQALGDQGGHADRRGQPSVRAVRKRAAMGTRP